MAHCAATLFRRSISRELVGADGFDGSSVPAPLLLSARAMTTAIPSVLLRSMLGLALGERTAIGDGPSTLPGLHAPTTIRRDAYGITYVEASNDDDAFFAMGFCQALDRSFQMELYLRVARGTLAEVLGPEMLPVDRLVRRLGFRHIARRQLALLAPRERAQLESFARGVNAAPRAARAKAHELTLLGIEASRFEAADIIAVLQFFAFALSSNWDAELARLRIVRSDGVEALEALEACHPDWLRGIGGMPALAASASALNAAEQLATDVAALGNVASLGGGSNAWAVAPSRTKTGRAILACDPHLSATLPAPWYLMHVRTPAWAISGAFFPGNPIPTFGHNERVAWAMTAGHADNTDLFLEHVAPDGKSVREGRTFQRCEVRDEVIAVKGAASVVEHVVVTPRGPIVSPAIGGDDVALSLRGTWMAERKLGGYDIYTARNVDEACASYASYPALSEGRVFADTSGKIASHLVGDLPQRKRGSGMLPAPGWDARYGWEPEPLPFAALPRVVAPARGFVATANQHPGESPEGAFLGADWLDGSRHARIVEVLATRDDWDVEATGRLQTDRKTMLWPRLRSTVLDALRRSARDDRSDRRAFQWLEAWDGDVAPESISAAIFELFFAEMVVRIAKARAPRSWRAAIGEGTNVVLPHGTMALRRLDHAARLLVAQPDGFFARGWPEEIADAIAHATQTLRYVAGDDDTRWAWGRVRPLFLVHAFGSKPPLDRIWNRGPIAWGGDATTIPQGSVAFDAPLGNAIGIPNLRAIIDVGNWEASRWVLAGGQSGNPLSPHYDDMIDLWLRGDSVTIAWSPQSVRQRAVNERTLLPA
jgi:penicillin G amidase